VRALAEGVLAGFGIAIPVGPIAVMLIDAGLRRGFRTGAAAAFGVASADLVYASIAALAGLAVADALEPVDGTVRIASGTVLLVIAAYRLSVLARASRASKPQPPTERSAAGTYAAFLGLTLLNPATIAYFAALIVGLEPGSISGVSDKFLFVAGAFAASAAWQLFLVCVAAGLHRRLTERARLITALLGTAIIVALALRLLI
jgi:threonine/homoserine/homoserine lactone efflux protein